MSDSGRHYPKDQKPMRLEETAADVIVNATCRTPTLDDLIARGGTLYIDASEYARLRQNSERWEWIAKQPWLYVTTKHIDAAIAAEKAGVGNA